MDFKTFNNHRYIYIHMGDLGLLSYPKDCGGVCSKFDPREIPGWAYEV